MKALKFLLYSVIFLLPLIIWHGTFYRGAIKDFFPQTAAFICLILLLGRRLIHQTRPKRKSTDDKSIIVPMGKTSKFAFLYLLLALLSLTFSRYRNFGIYNLTPLATAIFLFYITSTVIDKKSLEYLSHTWLLSSGIFSFYSILRFTNIISTPSLIGNRNLEAGYLVLTIPLALSPLIFEYEKWAKLRDTKAKNSVEIYGFLVILLSVAVAITLSRGATLGIVTGIFILAVCYKKTQRESIISRKFHLISSALLVLIIAGALLIIPIIKRGDIDNMGTIGIRLRIWKTTMQLVKERPLTGWGFGTFILSHGHYGTPRPFSLDIPRHAHCEPLQILCEMGFPGLIVFSLLLYFLFIEGFRTLKNVEPHLQVVIAGFISGVTALLSHNLVSVNLRYPCSLTLMWIAMGVVISQGRNKPSHQCIGGVDKHRLYNTVSIILIMLSVFLWKKFSLDSFRSQYNLAIGMRYCVSEKFGEKRFNSALERFDKASLLNTTEYTAYWMKAQIYEHKLQYRKAIESLHEFENIFPELGQLHGRLGDLYLKISMEDKAIPEFEHAIKLTPYVIDYYISLGGIYFKKKMYEDALNVYNRALELALIHPVVYNNIGNIHFANFEFEKALSFYRIAHALSPEDEGILYNLRQAESKLAASEL